MSESSKSAVLFEKRTAHVAVVTLNRPEARNAVNREVAEALEAAVDRAEADREIRTVVLTGAGGQIFCAGADLKEVARGKIDDLIRPRTGFAGFVYAKRTKPWIAAVEGLAVGGGCEIALACDLIVAAKGAAFGLPEATWGLVASGGGLFRLPRILPRAIAIELILTGNRLPAERAAELGMVNRIVSPGDTAEAAIELAKKIASNAPLVVKENFAIAKVAADFDADTLRRLSDEAQERIIKTEDFKEGALAFVKKRAPVWKGR